MADGLGFFMPVDIVRCSILVVTALKGLMTLSIAGSSSLCRWQWFAFHGDISKNRQQREWDIHGDRFVCGSVV